MTLYENCWQENLRFRAWFGVIVKLIIRRWTGLHHLLQSSTHTVVQCLYEFVCFRMKKRHCSWHQDESVSQKVRNTPKSSEMKRTKSRSVCSFSLEHTVHSISQISQPSPNDPFNHISSLSTWQHSSFQTKPKVSTVASQCTHDLKTLLHKNSIKYHKTVEKGAHL